MGLLASTKSALAQTFNLSKLNRLLIFILKYCVESKQGNIISLYNHPKDFCIFPLCYSTNSMFRKGFIVFLFSLIFNYCGLAQKSNSDSIKAVLLQSREDTSKVNTLLALSKSYLNTQPFDAIRYAEKAKFLSRKLNFKKGEAYALKNIGLANYMQGKYLETLDFWHESLKVFETIGDKIGVANMLNNIGAVYFDKGEDTKALEFYLKSLKIAEDIGDTLRIATACSNIGAVYFNKPATQEKALTYYLRALPLSEHLKDNVSIGGITVNLGEIYLVKGDDKAALSYFEKSLKAYEGTENIPYTLNSIGKVYEKQKDFISAINYHKQAYDFAVKLDAKLDMTQSLVGLARTYEAQGDFKLALANYEQAHTIGKEIKVNYELKSIYEGLARSYSKLGNFSNAFKYQSLLTSIKDTIYDIEADKKLSGLQFDFDIQKKQGEINLLTKDKALQDLELEKQKGIRNVTIGGLAMVMLFLLVVLFQNKKITREKKRSEELLLNILPHEVAEELKDKGTAEAKLIEEVSVLFTDFKGFTQYSEKLTPQELVKDIHECFSAFDNIMEKHGMEKIKTIGDAYMAAGGLPTPNKTHALDAISAALEIARFIDEGKTRKIALGKPFFEIRIGIHTGQVVAGIVGIKKYSYDIWGDTVNIASRMESSGETGKVNISGATYELVKDKFVCTHRGKVQAKNKGEIDMYFVEKLV